MQDIEKLPVLILAYNRYDKFLRCFETLYKQGIRKFFISIDGPKNEYDIKSQEQIISFCNSNKLNLDIVINYSKDNYGCRLGPLKGITWFFLNNKYGVIFEDDVIVTKKCIDGFSFLLEEYENCDQIMSISSFNEFSNNKVESLYSSPVWRSWGWASWSKKWQYHLNFSKKVQTLSMWELYKLMPNDLQSIDTVKLIKACHLNLLDAWDYEFNFTHVVNNKSSLTFGGINTLVYGFDKSATHTFDMDSIGIDFGLFFEREFNFETIKKFKEEKNNLLLDKCGFYYKKKFKYTYDFYNYFNLIYCSFIFYLRKIKRIMYKIL